MNSNYRMVTVGLLGAFLGILATIVVFLTVPVLSPQKEHIVGTPNTDTTNSSVSSSNQEFEKAYTANKSGAISTHDNSDTSNATLEDVVESWEEIVSDSEDDILQLSELLELGQLLWLQKGASALELIYESLSDTPVREVVMRAVLYQGVQTDFESAFAHAQKLKAPPRLWTLNTIVKHWVNKDLQATLETVFTLPSGVPATRGVQRSALTEWAELDPNAILQNIGTIPDRYRDFAIEAALFAMARQFPEEATAYLADLAGTQKEATLAAEIASNWIERDPEATIAWARSRSLSRSELNASIVEQVLSSYARKAPTDAFHIAVREPVHGLRGGPEAQVIAEVASTNIDTAVNLLQSVRDDAKTVFDSYLAVGKEMVGTHNAFESALILAQQLPHWHQNYYFHLTIHWASKAPIELLSHLDQFPNKYQSLAAKHLIKTNQLLLDLTTEQIQQAKKFLNSDDLKHIEDELRLGSVNVVQFATSSNAEYSAEELAELRAANRLARDKIKREREGRE